MQRTDDVLGVVVDMFRDIGREAVDIGIKAHHFLAFRVGGCQRADVHVAQWRCLAGKLVAANGIVLQVLAPFLDDFVGSDVQFGGVLAILDFFIRQGSFFGRVFLRQANCHTGSIGEVDAFGAVVAGQFSCVISWVAQE
ncbi:hypothetical protein D3C78_1516340 [compost metagenome]